MALSIKSLSASAVLAAALVLGPSFTAGLAGAEFDAVAANPGNGNGGGNRGNGNGPDRKTQSGPSR